MSIKLLLSSLIYELTGFVYTDLSGAAGFIYFSVKEWNEAFEKSIEKELFPYNKLKTILYNTISIRLLMYHPMNPKNEFQKPEMLNYPLQLPIRLLKSGVVIM